MECRGYLYLLDKYGARVDGAGDSRRRVPMWARLDATYRYLEVINGIS